MKTPTLGQAVLFAVLTDEPGQAFVATGALPAGEAVVQPAPYPGGFRAATVIGIADGPEAGRAALLVYKQPGDPFRGDQDAALQRIGAVPYSPHGVPGTWLLESDARALAEKPSRVVAAQPKAAASASAK